MLMTSDYPEKAIDKGGFDGTGIMLLRKPNNMADLNLPLFISGDIW